MQKWSLTICVILQSHSSTENKTRLRELIHIDEEMHLTICVILQRYSSTQNKNRLRQLIQIDAEMVFDYLCHSEKVILQQKTQIV